MEPLEWILAATIVNSLLALAGAFTLSMSRKRLGQIIFALVGFSAGALLSGAFFHLIAESIEIFADTTLVFSVVLVGFIAFFLVEKLLHWHHCHNGNCSHPVTPLILIGDGLHNFIDGLIIAASFLVNTNFGIITTLLIMGHELPQELGDFGVLIHGGFSRKKALFYNFLSQTTCIMGAWLDSSFPKQWVFPKSCFHLRREDSFTFQPQTLFQNSTVKTTFTRQLVTLYSSFLELGSCSH